MKRLFTKTITAFLSAVCLLSVIACSNTLRIMCYNVHHCSGMDDRIDYVRVGEIINRVQPDVVALQELDSATKRSNGRVDIEELANVTKMYSTYTPAIEYGGGAYGIGMLSKEKPLRHKVVALPGREEARRMLIVEFEKYVVCCTHLSLNDEDRMASMEIIRNATHKYNKPVFLAGDMNSTADTPEQKELGRYFVTLSNTGENTFPSLSPTACIDYIYGMKGNCKYTVKESKVLYGDSIASDHLPIYVDVKVMDD